MTERTESSTHNIPAWLIRVCAALTKSLSFLGAGLLDIVISLIATWLYTENATSIDYKNYPLNAFIQHWYIFIICYIALLGLYAVIKAIGNLPVVKSPAALRRQYLTSRIVDTQNLALEGVQLEVPTVRLDDIYIPLQLYPHQFDMDQLLPQEQRKQLRLGIRSGVVAPEVERVLISAEKQHELRLREGDTVPVKYLWEHLTRSEPYAVIQGYPGMGKSTLLLRLTLYMARRGNGLPDPLEEPVEPVLIPIFIRLGQYARFLREAKDKQKTSIWDYLASAPQELQELSSPGMLAWLERVLERGEALVLFDGLDEVSDPKERTQVQEAIKAFISYATGKAGGAASFQRFLITSRVAGYDKEAFQGYPHYTIAELTPEQISAFLPRWCRASARNLVSNLSPEEVEESLKRQAARIEQRLNDAIASHQGVRELVSNPFLLTLLAIMQQNGMELPRRRVELYSQITLVLLEQRNFKRNLPIIPEAQAIQRLGPIAYQMQASKNSFATKGEVLSSIANTITAIDQVPPEQAEKDALTYLERVRVRGGIFVLRTGDFYAFFHRTFQEYFAARYLLNLLASEPTFAEDLLQKAQREDDLWREPFLLALAYQISDVSARLWNIVRKLLTTSLRTDYKQYTHDILLAAQCLLEAKDGTIPHDLERAVVSALLDVYEDAYRLKNYTTCERVENVFKRRLLDISSEDEHSTLLLALQEAIRASDDPARQRATLTMLSVIAQDLRPCTPIVFTRLIPPLLGLTGLPTTPQPANPEESFEVLPPAYTPEFDVVDLALVALSLLGAKGPAGATLQERRGKFEQHASLLARYSLDQGFPITPALVPFDEENYAGYKTTIDRCLELHARVQKRKRVSEQDISAYTECQKELLRHAEEFSYPSETQLLKMLERSSTNSNQSWQPIWQTYLREQLETGDYLSYQSCALLWYTIFTSETDQKALGTLLLAHLSAETQRRRYAQRFLFTVTEDFRNMDFIGFGNLKNLKYFRDLRDFRYLRDVKEELFTLLWFFRDLRGFRGLGGITYLSYDRDFGYFEYLSELFFTEKIINGLVVRLANSSEIETAELLSLLLGRVLYIQKIEEKGPQVEQELERITQVVLPFAHSGAQDEALDVLRYLPGRTELEIRSILNCAQKHAADKELQAAFLRALSFARPETDEAMAVLAQAKSLPDAAIREALEHWL